MTLANCLGSSLRLPPANISVLIEVDPAREIKGSETEISPFDSYAAVAGSQLTSRSSNSLVQEANSSMMPSGSRK